MKIKNNKKRKLIIFIILTSLIISSGLFYFFYYRSSNHKIDNEIEQGTINYDSKFKSAELGNIIFPAYTEDIFLKKGQKELPILLVNPSANKDIYLQYKISIINENSKSTFNIGETKLIRPGKASKGIIVSQNKLKDLIKKVYNCRIDVFAFRYDGKNKVKLNQAYWDIKLHLE
ncbi:hypothetical protein [Enterococcus faecium]|uniref:hypothetical protein n=1 Tax=Enterococcus faecium TaxID=1352 RepID=UPI0006B28303|nr:hypothetical protein [Enterococcus faecium]OUZ27897.1 hypothetical protein A5806_002505 [Enterococcus faecium]